MSAENQKESASPGRAHTGEGPSLLQFGAFTLDLQRHGLYVGSKRIHLTSKPFETLAVLVEHRGKTVEKEKLLDEVWKEAFVTEDSLVKAVREIRRALNDEKSSPQFIQTVPGEGYRFIAEVRPVSRESEEADLERQVVSTAPADHSNISVGEGRGLNGAEDATVTSAPTRVPRRLRFATVWPVAAVVALLATLAAGILLQPWSKSEALTQNHIATLSGSRTAAASFSPDGNWITFINNDANGVPQVWVQNLAQGDPIPITSGDVPASHPRWSPRNDEIVFDRGEESKSLWSVPALGGLAPRLIIKEGRNPRWSWDGNRLTFERGEGIWTANADGSNQQLVAGIPQVELLIADREPSFSPDGSQIAFFQPKDGPMGDIWVIPSGGGQAKQLTSDNCLWGGLVWIPDGDHIVFSSQRGGSKTLWKIHRSGGTPEPVLKSAGEDTNPEISRDGTKLIYTSSRKVWVLTVKDVASGKARELRETITDMLFPSFSPKGDKIAFFATIDEGDTHLFTIGADGKDLTQVTQGRGERNSFPRWSADGSTLYFYQVQPDLSFRGISAAGGTSFEIARGWRWRTHNAAHVDPNGKRVIYSRVENSNAVATLVRELETETETVFKRTLSDTQWSSDGKFIVGVEMSGPCCSAPSDIVVCPVDAGTCREVATQGYWPVWSNDNAWIYFERWKSRDRIEIWAVSPVGEHEKQIAELQQADPDGLWYDLSRTGQAVYVQVKQGKQQLWMTDFH